MGRVHPAAQDDRSKNDEGVRGLVLVDGNGSHVALKVSQVLWLNTILMEGKDRSKHTVRTYRRLGIQYAMTTRRDVSRARVGTST